MFRLMKRIMFRLMKRSDERSYAVWSEGFIVSGESGTAEFLGRYLASSFKEACKKALISEGWNMGFYNESNNTYWGCNFYDDEKKARRYFG